MSKAKFFRITIISIALLTVLVPSTTLAWGPKTHIAIGERVMAMDECHQEIIENSDAFLLGSILPDIALVIGKLESEGNPVWLERHRQLHSQEFIEAMVAEADDRYGESLLSRKSAMYTRAFIAGWISHVISDEVERAYSTAKLEQGAPEPADYVVDSFMGRVKLDINIRYSIRKLIQHSLDEAYPGSWEISNKDWTRIRLAYAGYLRFFDGDIYKPIAEEWYYDYEPELEKSALYSVPRINNQLFR